MLIPSDRPAYRVLAVEGFYGPDDHLYREGDCIIFDGIPNEEMEPLNEIARKKLQMYSNWLDEEARKVAAKHGREFQSRPRNLDGVIAQASADARQVQLLQGGPGVPLMGGTHNKVGIQKLEDEEVPETGRRGPGRPKKGEGALSLAKVAQQQA